MRSYINAFATTAAALLALTTTAQAATGPVYSGYGWRIEYTHIRYMGPARPLKVTWQTSAARDRLTRYVKPAVAQISQITGVPITVTTTVQARTVGTCPPVGILHYTLEYRPASKYGISLGMGCGDSTYTLKSGLGRIDSEYWSPYTWGPKDPATKEAMIKNAITHETGHMIGLDHPNKDLDKDGVVEPYECEKTAYGYRPVLCSPNGGYTSSTNSGKFTSVDVPGIQGLVKNLAYRLAA